MNVTLELRYCDSPQRTAAAWLVPGNEPAAWLAEMLSWETPLAEAKLLIVPGAGLLVVLPGGKSPARGGVQPYGRLAERVLLPIEAALDPPLADRELTELLAPDATQYVWHPRRGLIPFAPEAVLRVADLLAPPRATDVVWDAAQPGIAFNQRLISIEPTQRLTLEDLIQEARSDIGSQPLAGSKLPSHPGEPIGGAVGQAVAQAGLAAAGAAAGAVGAMAAAAGAAMQGLAGAFGAGLSGTAQGGAAGAPASKGTTWLERLAQWAKDQQQAASSQLDKLRNRQVERLLNMLQESPDQGLRFAIPFGGAGQFRGLSNPTASLMERNVDFSLSRLGGGGSADFWNLPEEYRRKLAEQYRALANREISLGRHRRAAYIFAELLGDLTTAAATLAAGGHYREAAVLYEQRLHQPLLAARCLKQGGLWAEAIAIYEKLKQWETVGELYTQLEQREAAERAYRLAVEAKLASNDRLGAANLVEHKLQAPLEAQEILWGGWGVGSQDRKCLQASFDLLARHKLHDLAQRQVAELRPTKIRSDRAATAATILSRIAKQYPAAEICDLAAETTRGLIATRLPEAATSEAQELLAALAALVPADRLLARDCDRYQVQQASNDAERRRLSAGSRQKQRPVLRASRWFRLPPGEWQSAFSTGDTLFAAGWVNQILTVARGRWDGALQVLTGEHQPPQPRAILLAADPRGLNTIYVHANLGEAAGPLEFPATDKFPQPLVAEPHPGCEAETRVLSYGPGGTVLVGRFIQDASDEFGLLLTPYEGRRPLAGAHPVRLALEDVPDLDYVQQEPLPFFVRAADYYLGIGRLLVHKRLRQTTCLAPSPILSITGSAPHARPRIVLGCEQGGAILWGDTADAPQTAFAADLAEPAVGLNRGGWLIAATSERIEVFSTSGGQLNFYTSSDGPKAEPLAVLATDDNDRFAIVTKEGMVLIYDIPSRP